MGLGGMIRRQRFRRSIDITGNIAVIVLSMLQGARLAEHQVPIKTGASRRPEK